MRYLTILLFSLMLTSTFHAQERKKTFDEVFYDVAVNVTGSDSRKAIRIADSLYNSSQLPKNRIRSLMLKANVYSSIGDVKNAILDARHALSIAEESSIAEIQPQILGFLSTQHRTIGLSKRGRVYLEKGIKVCKSLPDRRNFLYYYGLALQEMAYYDHDDKANVKAVASLKKADSLFKRLDDSNEKFFFLATNEEMLGKEHLTLRNPLQSLRNYDQSHQYLNQANAQDSGLLGFIFTGKGKAFFLLKQYDSAFHYYNKSLKVAKKSAHANLLPEVYGNFAEYYFSTGDISKYDHFTKLQDSITKIQNSRNQNISDDLLQDISSDTESVKYSFRNTVLLLCFLLLIFCGVLALNTAKRRLLKEKVLLLDQRDKDSEAVLILARRQVGRKLSDKAKPQGVLAGTEQQILKKLEKFEKKEKFISKHVSLTSMAAGMETNSKYLSYVIKKNRDADFNTYINELRIRYIVKRMKDDSSYQNFKLSYLAEECGFSSHSKFSAVFKTTMGISPSDFISNLKEGSRADEESGNSI